MPTDVVIRTPPPTRQLSVLWYLLIPVLFLLLYRIGAPPIHTDDLDPSWTVVMAQAFAEEWRWGKDIVFTYGPLGFLHPAASQWPPTEGMFRWGQIILALLQAYLLAALFRSLDGPRRVYLAAALVVGSIGIAGDVLWITMPALSLVAMLRLGEPSSTVRSAGFLCLMSALFVAVVLCIKLSTLPLALAWWVAAPLVLWLNGRLVLGMSVLAAAPAIVLTVWLLCGQYAGDLLQQFRLALEFSAGYSRTMGYFPAWQTDLAGGAMVAGCVLLCVAALWRFRRSPAAFVVSGFFGLTFFVLWKAAYTRADLHTTFFFAGVMLLAPLVPALRRDAWPRAGALALLLALASGGMFLRQWQADGGQGPAMVLSHAWNQMRQSARTLVSSGPAPAWQLTDAARQKYDLPAVRSAVADGSIDLFGYQQSVVLLNAFNFRPRPVFQSYAAYTPLLTRINEDVLNGEAAPDYLLLPHSPLDGHMATAEDPLSVLALLRRYRPVLVEANYLLLKKSAPPRTPFAVNPATSGQRARLSEWVAVPETQAFPVLSYATNLTAAGKLFSFLVRDPNLFIELELSDGSVQRFRTTRDAGMSGFLVSPLVRSLDDWTRLFMEESLPRVVKFRLVPHGGVLGHLFDVDYTVAFTALSADDRPLGEIGPALLGAMYPGFSHRPAVTEGIVNRMVIDLGPVLFAHAPAALVFDLPVGTYIVDGDAGIRIEAMSSPGCAGGDGVSVRVGTESFMPEPVLNLNPFADAGTANPAHFRSGPIELSPGQHLRVEVGSTEPGLNYACDWSYLRNLQIRPL